MKTLFSVLLLSFTLTNGLGQKHNLHDSLAMRFNYLKNKPFEPLQLEDTAGQLFNTANLSGKTIYVDFWFTACPPCIREIPYLDRLQQYFSSDTTIVFLSICIENIDKKATWKNLIKEKELKGIHLFYARNRPQKVNLLRQYDITFPTYLLLNKRMEVIGYDAPRPSEEGWVKWAILKAKEDVSLSDSYREMIQNSAAYRKFIESGL